MTAGQTKQHPMQLSEWPLIHERGGLELDVSDLAGFTLIENGVTSEVGYTGSGNVVRATSPTITTPTISGDVDIDGLNLQFLRGAGTGLQIQIGASDVNYPMLTGSVYGSGYINLQAWGTDPDINVLLIPQGSGVVKVYHGAALREVVDVSGAQTLTNKTLTTPLIATVIGGTASGADLTLQSTTHATKGSLLLGVAGNSAYDEVNDRLGLGIADPSTLAHFLQTGDAADDATLPNFGLMVSNILNTIGLEVGIGFRISSAQDDARIPGAAITHERTGAASTGSLHLKTSADGVSLTTHMTIDKDGLIGGIAQLNVDNLRLDGNTISSTDANGDINLTPDGTGQAVIGNVGDIELGDGTERDMYPHTTLKINIGKAGNVVNRILGSYLMFLERSSDAPQPNEGYSVMWQSDGTGKGDDGDIMIASTAGGTTKYATLFDRSAGDAW